MASLNLIEGTVWFTIVYALIVLAYSIYQLYLNKKQAEVKGEIYKTNALLLLILKELEGKR